jgi:hypothetical protein
MRFRLYPVSSPVTSVVKVLILILILILPLTQPAINDERPTTPLPPDDKNPTNRS